MIIGDFDLVCVAIAPPKANAPLVVDPDAVLTSTIAAERFKTITGRHAQVFQFNSGIYNNEFTKPYALNVAGQFSGRLAIE